MAEWVGIDGVANTAGSDDLVQAGVMESMVPCQGASTDPNGSYSPGQFYVCPWTMFIANDQVTEGPVPQLAVNGGDTLTVEIWRESGTNWAFSMKDNTDGQSWSVDDQYYAGPGAAAEWVVEDPGDPTVGCDQNGPNGAGQCPPIAAFSPSVDFEQLGLSPSTVTTWYEVDLVQSGAEASTPSPLVESGTAVQGFTVSYSGAQPDGREQLGADLLRVVKTLATPVGHRTIGKSGEASRVGH